MNNIQVVELRKECLSLLQKICNSRIPVYCSYKLESRSLIPNLVRHHPFYKSKGFVPFIPSNHNPNENIYDYCIVCTKDEHPVLEQLSKVCYNIPTKFTEYGLNILKKIIPNSIEINNILEALRLYNTRIKIINILNSYVAKNLGYTSIFHYRCSKARSDAWKNSKLKDTYLHILMERNQSEKQKKCIREMWKNPEYKAKMSKLSSTTMIKNWQNSEYAKHIANSMSKFRKDSIIINDGKIHKYINKNEPIPEGFTIGMLPGFANATNRIYYNNGKVEIRLKMDDKVPIGYVKGRLPFKYMNNGIITKKININENIPDGWSEGRCPRIK